MRGPISSAVETITIGHIGTDTEYEQLREAVAAPDLPFEVVALTPSALSGSDEAAKVDCFVVSGAESPDLDVIADLDRPVVLYTSTDPLTLDEDILDAVDTVVEQWDDEPEGFLFAKILGLTRVGTSDLKEEAVEAVASERGDVAVFIADATGAVTWSNRQFEELFPPPGVPEDASLYERLGSLLTESPTDLQTTLELAGSNLVREGDVIEIPARDGTRYYRHYSYPLDADASERLEGFQEVTGVVERYDRLAQFEELVENAEDGLFVLDATGDIVYANESFAEMVAYDRDELTAWHISHVLGSETLEQTASATERLLNIEADSDVVDLRLETADGDRLFASIHVAIRYTEDGQYAGVIGVVRDITERKARERELERYETIIQAMGDPVCTIDDAGTLQYVNDAFETTTGYDARTARDEPTTLIMDEADAGRVEEVIQSLRRAGGADATATVEIDVRTDDDTVIPSECHLALLPHDEDFQGAVAVLRDVTEQKQREARLEKFASVVSHDLRNPMDVAIGRAEVLPEIADVDEETERHLHDIYDSLKRMEQLIQDVLALTRTRDEDLDLEPVSLGRLTSEAWSNVETGNASLSLEAGQEILGHPGRLLRLLENLFRNAVEHGGEDVAVEVGMLEGDTGPIGFYVADDGPGIPPADRDQIFEEGFSTSNDGTGLGLAIAHEIALAHGWEITLVEDAEGARFEITGVATV